MKIRGRHYRALWAERDENARGVVRIIDQTLLPHRFEIATINDLPGMVRAISSMQLRGAPLIGAAAAYGMALAVQQDAGSAALQRAGSQLLASRPTAVNLSWAVHRMQNLLSAQPAAARARVAWLEAAAICEEDVRLNQAIGQHGLGLLQALAASSKPPLNILTHCNAGWLATVDCGTALAPVYAAYDAGLPLHVWVSETRPRNQGASLTAWELKQHGVPHTVLADNSSGHLLQRGQVDVVIVGADRVTRRGDVCNKIGTYLKALAAAASGVPFYAALPSSTVDWALVDGLRDIVIEERSADEVTTMSGRLADGGVASVQLLPAGTAVINPAFDVTPAQLVTGLITERGICAPDKLLSLFAQEESITGE